MIADCAAYVFGHEGARLITPVQTSVKDTYGQYLKKNDPHFDNEAWRKRYRKEFRNNPNAIISMLGEMLHPGYGAITGEPGADSFVVLLEETLGPDDVVLIASDGCRAVPPEEMNEILTTRIREGKPNIVLPEIFGRAQMLANDNGKHSDDRTGILFVPEHLVQITHGNNIPSAYSIDS